jgi:hypothetical protein
LKTPADIDFPDLLALPPKLGHYHEYQVYGIILRSDIVLPLPQPQSPPLGSVELLSRPENYFAESLRGHSLEDRTPWHRVARLPDGSDYVSWKNLGEFLVSSDGLRVACRKLDHAAAESFRVYLLGQALSYAVVKQGLEPLHATALAIDGGAVAFMGGCGFGKSTLAAYLMKQGHRLLTDDMLILQQAGECLLACPGPARIKLFPGMARRFLGESASGIAMNPDTQKVVIPVDQERLPQSPAPLSRMYHLCGPDEVPCNGAIRIEALAAREAFMCILSNTFTSAVADVDRLRRQAGAAEQLLRSVKIKKLFYPRVLGRLPDVMQAILEDLHS